ncbi:non-ribosomal peptide synthetase [Flavobacterium sp. FlaQc-51]|uniref:non-ribosomal peptide synthetase n=1 Tax=unclassified Flavobacterium TaxID=196869 RepID=UPI0009E68CF4|nr:non-ribosomal peptide synthetase [Flavobacterium sp. Leaf82]
MIENIYKLTPLQSGIYYHWITSNDNSLYFQQMSYRINVEIVDLLKLEESFKMIIDRYQILRTVFTREIEDQLLQIVKKTGEYDVEYLDFTEKNALDLADFKIADRNKGFNLEKGPLMRLKIIKLEEGIFEFIWSYHHILMDGWCHSLITKDFFKIYNALLNGTEIDLGEVAQYSNYIVWLESLNKEKSLNYWEDYLKGFNALTGIPKNQTNALINSEPKYVQFDLEFTDRLRESCKELEITENIFIQTVWSILLAKWNNATDVLFGIIVSGRPANLDGIENMIGLFINSIPVRVQFEAEETAKNIALKLHDISINSLDHHYNSLSEIQSKTNLKRGLFDHLLVFENYPVEQMTAQSTETQHDFKVNHSEVFEYTSYDLSLDICSNQLIDVRMSYNPATYSDSQVELLKSRFLKLAEEILDNPDAKVHEIEWVSEDEKNVLDIFNDTHKDFDKEKTFLHLFESKVEKTPNAIAVIFEDKSISYSELNKKANQLANYLSANHDIKTEDLIGVQQERSEKMIISILAIFKLAAAYVPIDPEYPQDRIDFIKKSCKIVIDSVVFEEKWQESPADNLPVSIGPDNLAYVIYTSGTTGKPKGAMIEHLGMINHIHAKINDLNISEQSRIAQNASQSFDISVWQALTALVTGGTTIIYSKELIVNPSDFLKRIQADKTTILEVVPSYLSMIFDLIESKEVNKPDFSQLKFIILTGETLKFNLLEKWFNNFPDIPVMNAYGPTEASDDITHYITHELSKTGAVPIGKPVQNFSIYIVDEYFNICPVGVKGEICVSGIGVCRGYFNEKELTAKVFVENPFRKGERMYKTGDIGRWSEDGNIEFFGRKDYQVKIKGHRIELEEIEVNLNLMTEIKQVAVIEKSNDNQNVVLVAYYSANQPEDIAAMRNHLKQNLPAYMIPSFFIHVDKFPLTPNGKTDREALKALNLTVERENLEEELIMTATEEKLLGIWQDILEEKNIRLDEDFFELGGDSFKAIRLVSKVKNAFTVNDLYNNPTIKTLAAFMDKISNMELRSVLLEKISSASDAKIAFVSVPNSAGEPFSYRDTAFALQDLNKEVDFYAVKLPRTRLNNEEMFEQNRIRLIKEIVSEIESLIKVPVIVFGQCNGSPLAVGIADLLRQNNFDIRALSIGGMLAPTMVSNQPDKRTDADIIEFLGKIGGKYPEVSPDKEFFINNIRFDSTIATLGFYHYCNLIKESNFKKFDFPIYFITGDKDPLTKGYSKEYKKWYNYSNEVEIHVIPNVGHYLLRDAAIELAFIFNNIVEKTTKELEILK